MTSESTPGIVYVLTNPAMPGIVKIGKTSRESVHARLNELYSTGVPVPFECVFAGRVQDESKVEKAFHMAFGPYRLNPNREFFEIEPEQAITLLKLLIDEDVTPSLQLEADSIDADSKDATRKLKSRRPNLNFIEMGIPIGAVLEFTQSQEQTVEVVAEKKVRFKDEECSLTAATRELLQLEYSVAPGPYWLYQGRVLRDIYNETYEAN
jgi:hypothetical protein